jgi:hypothetical protein
LVHAERECTYSLFPLGPIGIGRERALFPPEPIGPGREGVTLSQSVLCPMLTLFPPGLIDPGRKSVCYAPPLPNLRGLFYLLCSVVFVGRYLFSVFAEGDRGECSWMWN